MCYSLYSLPPSSKVTVSVVLFARAHKTARETAASALVRAVQGLLHASVGTSASVTKTAARGVPSHSEVNLQTV